MQIDVFDMMKLQLDALGIQTLPLSAPYDNFPDFDYRFLKHTFINYDYSRLLDSLKKYAVSGTVLHFHEHHLVHYIFFTFPEELQENYEYDSCLIGPVLFETVNLARFQKFIDLFRIPPEHYQDAREFLNRIPVVPSSDFWLTSIFPFLNCCSENPSKSRTRICA